MKFTIRLLLVLLATFAPAGAASAQAALVNIKIQFLQNGAVLPTQVMTITLPSGAACGQVKLVVPPSVFVNTTGRLAWDDPTNPLLDCVAVQSPGGVLLSLPLGGNYTAIATFTDDVGVVSGASLPSNPFTRGVRPLPPVPTGVRVLP